MKTLKRMFAAIFVMLLLLAAAPIASFDVFADDDYPAEYKNTAQDETVDAWNFYNRECTSFVAWCLNSRNGVPFSNWYGGIRWGHAKDWGTAASNLGIAVNGSPAVGSVAWSNAGAYGHVAWVSSVDGGNVTVEEYNYNGDGAYNVRSVPSSRFTGYIHIQDMSSGGSSGPSASFAHWENPNYTYINETDAAIGQEIHYSGGNCTDTGVALYDAGGNLLAEGHNGYYTDKVCFWINRELGYTLTPGTTYRYKFFAVVDGSTFWGDEYSFTTTGSAPRPEFTFDLNGRIDGANRGDLSVAGTVDVYLDGSLAANDCSDFCQNLPSGTMYEIKDIKAAKGYAYEGVYSGALSGTITERTEVCLAFTKQHVHILQHYSANAATEQAEGNVEYWFCSDCGRYFSDADAVDEITKAQTVVAKLDPPPKIGNWEQEENNTIVTANSIQLNTKYNGNLASSSDVDWYSFTLPKAGVIQLSFEHEYLDSSLPYWRSNFLTSNNERISAANWAGNMLRAEDAEEIGLDAGTYYLQISNYYWTDTTYQFTVEYTASNEWEKELNGTIVSATPVRIDTQFNGAISTSDDVDWYQFTVPAALGLTVNFDHPYIDSGNPFWQTKFYGADNREIASTSNTWAGNETTTRQSAQYAFEPGTYYLRVSGYYHNWSTYHITLVSGTIVTPATGISLNSRELQMKVGETKNLTASVMPTNTTDTVYWSSSNPSIATVNDGAVKALSAGTVNISAKAGEKTATCAVTVSENTVAPSIQTSSLPGAVVSTAYTQTLTATGTAPITWSLSSGSLPEGLTISSGGVISGTPSKSGTFSVSVQAKNAAGSDVKNYTISVADSKISPMIQTTSLPDGTLGSTYSQNLSASGTPPITWSISSGSLPDGLTLTGASISGTPVKAGTYSFTVQANNSAGNTSKTFTIKVNDNRIAPTIQTASLHNATVGSNYSQTITATGTAPITWTITSGTLPDGLVVSPSGMISGTPTKAGDFNFTIQATNTAGSTTKTFQLKTTANSIGPTIVTVSLPDATVGEAYTQALSVTGTAPILWSLESGVMPDGLSLNPSGTISGTPTKSGGFSFTVQAKNSVGSVSKQFSLTISDKYSTEEVHFERITVYFQDQFSDVPANQWYTDNVAAAFELGLMKGTSATTFHPFGDVTVAEAITMAARIHSIYTKGTENFDQSQGSHWYDTYLEYAYSNGIIPYAYYNSDVNHKASRSQFAEIFSNCLPDNALKAINKIEEGKIPDVNMNNSYAAQVYKLYRAGILTGSDTRGTFNPSTYITRAEVATIVSRMADSFNRVEFSL